MFTWFGGEEVSLAGSQTRDKLSRIWVKSVGPTGLAIIDHVINPNELGLGAGGGMCQGVNITMGFFVMPFPTTQICILGDP